MLGAPAFSPAPSNAEANSPNGSCDAESASEDPGEAPGSGKEPDCDDIRSSKGPAPPPNGSGRSDDLSPVEEPDDSPVSACVPPDLGVPDGSDASSEESGFALCGLFAIIFLPSTSFKTSIRESQRVQVGMVRSSSNPGRSSSSNASDRRVPRSRAPQKLIRGWRADETVLTAVSQESSPAGSVHEHGSNPWAAADVESTPALSPALLPGD